MKQKNVEVSEEQGYTMRQKKIRVQYETKKNCTFNSSLALVL